ncbi:MAG TPA: hypothetical protein VKR53_19890 [Puia sp.]|nr:hypothetical protein [Puia sp.]
MITYFHNGILFFFCTALLGGCLADKKYYYPKQKENQELEINRRSNEFLMRKLAELPPASMPTLQERMDRTKQRGLFAPIAINVINEATSAIKTIIANEQSKYTSVSQFTKTDLYFYDQPSLAGVFDPAGMQFTGFDLIRTIDNGTDKPDTAFIAGFELDTTKTMEILNNSVFQLKLKNFRLKYVKPKVSVGSSKKMSVEFDISFLTSYVNRDGSIFDSVLLGKFHLLLKDISIDLNDPGFGTCAANSGQQTVYGRSFIVPRSSGYFKTDTGVVAGYNQGVYSIVATVKESTHPSYGSAIINENGILILNTASGELSRKIHN